MTKQHLKWELLIQDKTLLYLHRLTPASFPHSFSRLFLKYTYTLLKGRVGDDIKPHNSTKLFYSWVSHWMVWSICQSLARSANGKKLTQCPVDLLGLLMKILPPCSQLFCHLLQLSASAPLLQVCMCKSNLSGQISPVLWCWAPAVTWHSREVVLPCVLWGMNGSSSSFLKTHAVRDPFLGVNCRNGKFYDQIRLLVKITALRMLKNGFMKENRYRTVNALSLVWQKHLWLNDCGFSRDLVGVTLDAMFRSHWISKEAKRTNWFKDNIKARE